MDRTLSRISAAVLALGLALVASHVQPAFAGPYADDLSRCLVRSTSASDKATLVRWVFALAAAHPDVRSMTSLSDEQRSALNRQVAGLYGTLLTGRCADQAGDALRYEGQAALESSFSALGQAAMTELLGDPAVSRQLDAFAADLDPDQLARLLPRAD